MKLSKKLTTAEFCKEQETFHFHKIDLDLGQGIEVAGIVNRDLGCMPSSFLASTQPSLGIASCGPDEL